MPARADSGLSGAGPGTLWVVSAPSGAGKTSLTQALVERLLGQGIQAAVSVSFTTRPPRPGEENGRHYHFVGAPTFERMVAAGGFLEHAEVFGRWYGSGRAETERLLAAGHELFCDIDWQGARQLRERVTGTQSIFVLPPSMAALEGRLRRRGQDDEAIIARRMHDAREEIAHYSEYDFVVVNDAFEQALDGMTALIHANRLRATAQRTRHAALLRDLLD